MLAAPEGEPLVMQGAPPGGHGPMPEHAAKTYLAQIGIAVPQGGLARGIGEAKDIAARTGYPVALKAQTAELTHKSDIGGVALDIRDAATLEAAWQAICERIATAQPDLTLDGFLVETMAPPGPELIVGARRDPAWGPVVLVGLGGVWTEALGDIRLMPPTLSRERVIAEIGQLRGAALLRGMRGARPVDVAAIADVVVRIGALMRSRDEIVEIDINPLRAYPDGVLALDALIVSRA
jgi:acyl-CoA synthetase (NDP forming)